MISKDHAQMLATLACATRPTGARQWQPAAVMTEIAKLRDRSLSSVALAVLRAAADRHAERPEIITSSGSHWSDTMLTSEWIPNRPNPEVTAREKAASVDTSSERGRELVAAARANLAPTAGPTEHRTLADMAEANPKLHARIEALREANPGLHAPPMQEPTDEHGEP